MGVGHHNHYTTICCYVPNLRLEILLFQSLHIFSSASSCPNIQPYLSTRWTGQTHLANSQAATTPPAPTHKSSTTNHKIRHSVPASSTFPPSLLYPVVAHSTPTEVLHLQQIHTQALAEIHTHPQWSTPHTPAPPFSHPQPLPFCKSQHVLPTHNLTISPIIHRGHSCGSKTK